MEVCVELKNLSMPKLYLDNELMDFQQESGLIASAQPSMFQTKIQGKKFDDIIGAGYYAESTQSQSFGQAINSGIDVNHIFIEDHFKQDPSEVKSRSRDNSKDKSRLSLQQEDENYIYQRFKSFVKKQNTEAEIDPDDSKFMVTLKLFLYFTIQKPITIIRNLTVPMQEEDNWNRFQAYISLPIGYVTFLYFTE